MSIDDQLDEILQTISMEELLKNAPFFEPLELGKLVEGKVISISKNRILVDLEGAITGIITGKEARDSSDTASNLQIGNTVYATVIDTEDPEGLVILSLRRASRERTWKRFLQAYENKEIINVKAHEANKGGLLLEIDGIKGFIPVSQLAPLHYPRVNGADSTMILERLERLVGQKFDVRIINIDCENAKLILSEKAAQDEIRKTTLQKLKTGQKVQGLVSGVVKFGIFVAFDGLEGLVHISEIAWGHVKNPADYAKLGDKVEVMIIGIDKEKISLSIKRLIPDPWAEISSKFPVGKIVEGIVNRFTQFGVFVKLTDDINGLIHTSEIGNESDQNSGGIKKIGQKVMAKVINVDQDERRIGLTLKLDQGKQTQKIEDKEMLPEKVTHKDAQVKDEAPKASSDMSIFLKKQGLSQKAISALQNGGYRTFDEVKKLGKEKLIEIPGIGVKTAEKILEISL